MSDSKRLNIRLSGQANEALDALTTEWKCGQTAAVERAIIEAQSGLAMRNAVFETLELMQSLPDTMREVFEEMVESMPKAQISALAIPGVQQGYAGVQKPRESSLEKAERERQLKMDKARARSSVGDDPDYVFDPEFVQD